MTTSPDADLFALQRDKVRAMFSYNPTSLAGHAVGALVVLAVFGAAAPESLRWGWGLAMAFVVAVRTALAWQVARHEAAMPKALARQLGVWTAGTLVTAALWGWAAWSFIPYGSGVQQLALILVAYTFCVACIPILAPQFGLYLVFNALVYLPAIARVALLEGVPGLQAASVMAVALAMTLLLGRNYRDAFERASRLHRQADALAEQLRNETAVAEAARRDAEVANRAKTQFFAAASHDLRQPLHAMGLFAEALRQRSQHDPEAARLVNSINDSVDALEGLFTELLDITRIESGGVDVRPVDFAVGDIMRRLRLHFEPAAFDKGLGLTFRGTGHRAHGDVLIVERILRNLVANAIRYSADGGVLVSCRRRGGGLLLQVWDTGPGIAPSEQARIFEEFYQVPGTDAPAAGQKKGLGLGLAIVRRLAALIGSRLELRSVPRRGSVFGFTLPVALAAAPAPALPAATGVPGLTLEGRRICIVEDDAAVRLGLEVLLQGWGAQVQSHGGFAEALAAARPPTAGEAAPHLLIVDYRLEAGLTGIEVIAALRRAYGAALPAIVVTGSTMTGLDAEAEREGFHLMVKPVVPARLRAMIAFKLGLRGAAP
ncbi:MAG TPA: hybrid sensor histidine kinase/response regulator [Burkholderiaceae bacterium]|nr:hybrid sensor histidine kinase/response regulator [Burkholderiaceae bacterium]